MTNISYALSIIIGSISGISYGLFYLFSKKRVLSMLAHQKSKRNILIPFFYASMRITFIAAFMYLILLSSTIHSILTITCFLASFWAIILYKKAR